MGSPTVPILMLSVREAEIDKVLGLELGADDYLIKPFGLRELLARAYAMLRRADMAAVGAPTITLGGPTALVPQQAIQAGNLVIDVGKRLVTQGGAAIDLKPKEFDLLTFLAANPQQVFAWEVLLDRVWGYDFVGGTRTNLYSRRACAVATRQARVGPGQPEAHPDDLIQTVYGVEYRFNAG